jgi:hypothetical protein
VRPLGRRAAIAIYAILVAILIGVIVAAGLGQLAAQWWAGIGVAVSILTVLLTAVQSGAGRAESEKTGRELAQQLAPRVRERWEAEMVARGLESRLRIAVRWRLVPGSNPDPELAGLTRRGTGTLDQLIDLIGRNADGGSLPRLVVTGEMGGGKTAAGVLLIVQLAGKHDTVPVLFQLGAWDQSTSLRAWMARQVLETFPAIGKAKDGMQVAGDLVSRYVLPILDGLDEAADPGAALRRIDEELSGRPFVLTCRTVDFERANSGHVLHQSVIVELQPLRPQEARKVLLAYEPATVGGPLAALAAGLTGPSSGAAAALSTPFMVSLARDSSAALRDVMPGTAGADDADQIRKQLLGTFVRTTYSDDRMTPDQARRYLKFLARHTDEAGRIAWWRMHLLVPKTVAFGVAIILGAIVCSGLAAVSFNLFNRPWAGFWIGLTAGVVGAVVVESIPQDDPRRARPRLRSVRVPAPYELARTLAFGLMGAAALVVMTWVLYGSVRYMVIGGVLSGFTFAVARYLSQPNDPLKVVTPGSLLHADRAATLYALPAGAIPGALTGFFLGYSFPAGHRPTFDSLAILHYRPVVLALIGAAAGCVLSAAGLGLMANGWSASGRFLSARIWLALRGWLPFDIMGFLQDAYKRGVLRQVNGYYEFRHRILQRYLAEPSPDAAARPRS